MEFDESTSVRKPPNFSLFMTPTPPSTPPSSKPSSTSTSTYTSLLTPTPREAILDALYRLVLSYDTADLSLHDSAFTQHNPSFTLTNTSSTLLGLSRIRTVFDDVAPLDTTHHISNPRIQVVGEGEARVTATVLAQHYRPGEGLRENSECLLGGSLYEAEVVRDERDGLWRQLGEGEEVWRIRSLKMRVVWTEGDGRITNQDSPGGRRFMGSRRSAGSSF